MCVVSRGLRTAS